jgi:hypothetical protein
VTRDRQDPDAVSHDDVFTLSGNSETGLFERAHRIEMIYARDFRQLLSDTSIS